MSNVVYRDYVRGSTVVTNASHNQVEDIGNNKFGQKSRIDKITVISTHSVSPPFCGRFGMSYTIIYCDQRFMQNPLIYTLCAQYPTIDIKYEVANPI